MGAQRKHNPWAAPPGALCFLRVRQVGERIGVKPSTIYRMVQRGEFPKPIKLSARWTVWRSDEIDAWQQQRIAAAD